MNKVRVLELFGGIGSPHKALSKIKNESNQWKYGAQTFDYELVDMIEFDKNAVKSYNAIHGTNFEVQDVTTWNKDIKVDYLHASTPCQAFSTAGKGKGAEDSRGANLWEHTIRIIKLTKPTLITLENVKGLLQAKHKELLDWYLNELELLGYKTEYQVLNAKYFDIPQNRERVFFVSRNDGKEIVFPKNNKVNKVLKDILFDRIDDPKRDWITLKPQDIRYENVKGNRFTLSDGSTREIFKEKQPLKTMNIPLSNNFTQNVFSSVEGQATTLTTFPKYIYFANKLSQYTGKAIEINLEKLMTQNRGEINRVAKIKKPLFSDLNFQSKPETLDFASANHFKGAEGIVGTLRASSDTIHEQKGMKLEDIPFREDSSFNGTQGIVPTLTATAADFKQKIITLEDVDKISSRHLIGSQEISPTLDTRCDQDPKILTLLPTIQYRKLLPAETLLLMGFNYFDYLRAKEVCSDAQITKQAGNSIVVNVMEELLKVNGIEELKGTGKS